MNSELLNNGEANYFKLYIDGANFLESAQSKVIDTIIAKFYKSTYPYKPKEYCKAMFHYYTDRINPI